jgi:predicted transcriptional regulator
MFPIDSWNFPCRRRAVLHITMDNTYHNIKKKLDTLCKHQHHIPTNTTPKYTFHKRLINLTNVDFNIEQIRTLNLEFHCAIEKHPSNFINTLIVETETAVRHLDPSLQNTYRHLAFKMIKQIMNTNYCNVTHKRIQYTLKQIRTILEHNNLSLVKADKGKTVVVIHTDTLQQKVHHFRTD